MRLRLLGLTLAQLALVGVAVGPQLVAHATGEDYRMRVQPLDPIDPFRGAYVTLDYPDLRDRGDSRPPSLDDGERGEVFVTLVEEDGFWVMAQRTRTRPDSGPYLACDDRDWAIRCGIESYFVPQDRARELERQLVDGGTATVRIDSRGNAAVIAVDGE